VGARPRPRAAPVTIDTFVLNFLIAPPSFDDLIVCFRSRSQSDALAGNDRSRSGGFAKTPNLERFCPNERHSQIFIFA
jgi:hypothetical protein